MNSHTVNSFLAVAVATATMSVAPQALASEALAKSKACMACHAKEEKVLGPSYVQISQKYADQKDAAKTLANSIKGGSTGKWGNVAMPANASLTDDETKRLVDWILKLK